MGLQVNTNIAALNAYRNLSVTDGQMRKSLEKLSSGFRINRAADDAAGLAISEGLRSQIGGLKVAVPEPAVGGEGLLRREVVDVGLPDVDREATGAAGRVDEDQRVVVGPVGTLHRRHDAGRG